jgi:hypothetical protein
LNQKLGLKFLGAVDFASRFVIIIKVRVFNLDFIESTNLDAKSTALKDFKPNF